MKKIIGLIGILILLLSTTFSVEPLFNASLDSAIHAMHNMNYEKSRQILTHLLKNDRDNSYAPVALILNDWYQMLGLYGNKFNKKILLEKCDTTINVYKKQLETAPNDFDLNFGLALAVGFKSRIVISEKNSFFVMVNGVKALKYLRKCNELAPDNPDLGFCKGIFEYYLAEYPGIVKYFANKLLANSGNKTIAKKRMHRAAKAQGFLKYDANFILAFIYLYIENQPHKAFPFINLLVTEFPKNPNYHFLQTFAHLQLEEPAKAKTAFSNYLTAINQDNPYYREEFQNRKDFLLAFLALKNGDSENANRFFNQFTDNYMLELEHLLAITYLEQGRIAARDGKEKTARDYFKKVLDIDNQTYPMALARQQLKK